MKKTIVMMVMVTGMTVATTPVMAADVSYIPWTFDDFDGNCDVVESAGEQSLELSVATVEINDETEAGELGW